jgi:hypothetical protein
MQPLRKADLSASFPSDNRPPESIPVICWTEPNGIVRARAPGLGLLVEGEGETDESAMQNLAEIVVEQKARLSRMPIDRLAGNALFLRRTLERLIPDPAW